MIQWSCRSCVGRRTRMMAIALVALPLAAGAMPWGRASSRVADADFHGHVMSQDGRPLAGAQLQMTHLSGERSGDHSTVTDKDGAFAFHQLAEGYYELSVRRLGYKPSFMEIQVGRAGDLDLTIKMVAATQTLDTIAVKSDQEMPQMYGRSLRMAQFYERRQLGIGHFFTREDIEDSHTATPADLIRRVGGMHVWEQGNGVIVKATGCIGSGLPGSLNVIGQHATDTVSNLPNTSLGGHDDGWGNVALFVDGSPVPKGYRDSELGDLKLVEIEGLEVYRSPAELPMEASGNACAAVFVWTRIGTS